MATLHAPPLPNPTPPHATRKEGRARTPPPPVALVLRALAHAGQAYTPLPTFQRPPPLTERPPVSFFGGYIQRRGTRAFAGPTVAAPDGRRPGGGRAGSSTTATTRSAPSSSSPARCAAPLGGGAPRRAMRRQPGEGGGRAAGATATCHSRADTARGPPSPGSALVGAKGTPTRKRPKRALRERDDGHRGGGGGGGGGGGSWATGTRGSVPSTGTTRRGARCTPSRRTASG